MILRVSISFGSNPALLGGNGVFYLQKGHMSFLGKLFGKDKKGKGKPDDDKPPLTVNSTIQSCEMKMPIVGLGTWQMSPICAREAVENALRCGYRHIDSSYIFKNEEAVGKAIQKAIDCGVLCREDLFVSSKLPNFAMHPNWVEEYLYRSLRNLKLQYLDLYMIHFPVAYQNPRPSPPIQTLDNTACLSAVWQTMENFVYAGYIKHLGLSNVNVRQIEDVLGYARIPPTNVQMEMHVYCQNREVLNFCKCRNITVTAYAPLGSPGLSTYLNETEPIASCAGADPPPIPLTELEVRKMAHALSRTPAQVLLRYLLQLGVAVIPKTTDPKRIQENIDVFDFSLSDADMGVLAKLDKGNDGRYFHSNVWKGLDCHHDFPFPPKSMK